MLSAKDTLRLNITSSKWQKFEDRAFSVAGPRIWNDLPRHIIESSSVVPFKQTLKTHLFNLVYPSKMLLFSFLACQGRIQPMECIAPYKKTLLLLLLLLLRRGSLKKPTLLLASDVISSLLSVNVLQINFFDFLHLV